MEPDYQLANPGVQDVGTPSGTKTMTGLPGGQTMESPMGMPNSPLPKAV